MPLYCASKLFHADGGSGSLEYRFALSPIFMRQPTSEMSGSVPNSMTHILARPQFPHL